MRNKSFPVMTISLAPVLLLCVTATSAFAGAPSSSAAFSSNGHTLHATAASNFTNTCSCCLAYRENHGKTINMWAIMSSKDAKELLPVIYLARQHMMEGGQLPDGWNINISFLNSKDNMGKSSKLAYESYMSVTRKCLQKSETSFGCERSTLATGRNETAACSHDPAAQVPDVGVYLATGDYVAAKVAELATRWQMAVLSPDGSNEMMSDAKYSSLYRLYGDSSQIGDAVLDMAYQWGWNITFLVYEDNDRFQKCKGGMQSIKNRLRKDENLSDSNVNDQLFKFPMDDLFDEIEKKSRIVFTCFTNGSNLRKFYERANTYNETEYAFINLDLATRMVDSHRPWAKVGKINETTSPRLVITSQNPQNNFSDEVTAFLSDPKQEELRETIGKLLSNNSVLMESSGYNNTFSKKLSETSPRSSGKKQTYLSSSDSNPSVENFSGLSFAASVYEGVWFFVEAFKRALERYKEHEDFSRTVLEELNSTYTTKLGNQRNQTYYVTNRVLPNNLVLLRLNRASSQYEEAGYFENNGGKANVNFVDMEVYTPPKDEPDCGFDGKGCSNRSPVYKVIVVLGCLLAVLVVGVIGVLVLSYRSKMKQERRWQIPRKEIICPKSCSERSNSFRARVKRKDDSSSIQTEKDEVHMYKDENVHVRHLKKPRRVSLTDSLQEELQTLKVLKHSNIVGFIGACFEGSEALLVTEHCSRGSLEKLLKRDLKGYEDCIKYPLFMDLISGLSFLHKSSIRVHGNLKSRNCVLDSRLVLKLSGFGLRALRHDSTAADEKLWTAPELLRKGDKVKAEDLTHEADVYSVGIIMNEVFSGSGSGPFPGGGASDEIIEKLKSTEGDPYRPNVKSSSDDDMMKKLVDIIKMCWDEQPLQRPPLTRVRRHLRQLFRRDDKKSHTLVHDLLSRLEFYANTLQVQVEKRTNDYKEEKEKWKNLLHDVLPTDVAKELIHQRGDQVTIQHRIAENYEQVTIYFSDIVDFSDISAQLEPMQIVNLLDDLYSVFDEVISNFNVYKVETIGDAYVVAAGLPKPSHSPEHAEQICSMALELLKVAQKFPAPHKPGDTLQIRIGINSGPCAAGVMGYDKPRYCIFGDTVNVASRMESTGLSMKIHISESTYKILKENYPEFVVEERGNVKLKGKGIVTTSWLLGKTKRQTNTDAVNASE